MGGASYVNVAYCVLNNHKIPKNAKEVSLSICGITNDTATLMSSVSALIISNSILKTNTNKWLILNVYVIYNIEYI